MMFVSGILKRGYISVMFVSSIWKGGKVPGYTFGDLPKREESLALVDLDRLISP